MLAIIEITSWHWIGFVAFVLVVLALDLGVFHRRAHIVRFREALLWTAIWFCLAMLFALWFRSARDQKEALQFVTLNPAKRDLLARAANRIERRARATTADHEVARRRRLLLDFDPVRPAGVSSTDEEHAVGAARALVAGHGDEAGSVLGRRADDLSGEAGLPADGEPRCSGVTNYFRSCVYWVCSRISSSYYGRMDGFERTDNEPRCSNYVSRSNSWF